MKFTLVFSKSETEDVTLSCIFAPCLIWRLGKRTLLNPHPSYPLYQSGDLQNLIVSRAIGKSIRESSKKMCLIAHATGYGTERCLERLTQDLLAEGFEPEIVEI